MLSIQKDISELSDEQLIQRYKQSGNKELVGVLYTRYHHLAFGACLKFLKNSADSSDLVVLIFERILERLATDEVHNFNSWLYSLCKNECFSFLRKQQAARNRHEQWEGNAPGAAGDLELSMENEALLQLCEAEIEEDPEEAQEAQEAQVKAAIRALPQEQRVCIKLFFYKQKSYQEIADKTSFSLLQVKSYLQNGKRNLKKLLQESI